MGGALRRARVTCRSPRSRSTTRPKMAGVTPSERDYVLVSSLHSRAGETRPKMGRPRPCPMIVVSNVEAAVAFVPRGVRGGLRTHPAAERYVRAGSTLYGLFEGDGKWQRGRSLPVIVENLDLKVL